MIEVDFSTYAMAYRICRFHYLFSFNRGFLINNVNLLNLIKGTRSSVILIHKETRDADTSIWQLLSTFNIHV